MNTREIFKEARHLKKNNPKHVIYWGARVRIMSGFSLEIRQRRREWSKMFKELKENPLRGNRQPRVP